MASTMIQSEPSLPQSVFGSFFFSKQPSKLYRMERSVCSNPFCGCASMVLDLFGASPEDTQIPFSVTVDAVNKKRGKRQKRQSPSQDKLARFFLKELNEQDWTILQNRFFSDKMSAVESFDYNNETYEGLYIDNQQIELVDSTNELMAYAEIFPFGSSISIIVNNTKYEVFEHFCAKSKCLCADDALFISQFEDQETDERVSHSFLFDYRARTVVPLGTPPADFPSASEILEALNKTPSTSFTETKKRNDRVKLVYKRYKQQKGIAERYSPFVVPDLPKTGVRKVGRNEPCPCGSGRKFKHCCGN